MSTNDFVAGLVSGVAGVVVGHPFDTAKIQMQIRTAGDHRIMRMSHAWATVKAQGLKKGMFRGMMFPVVSYGLVNSVFFGVYGNAIKFLEPNHNNTPTNLQVYTAGCIAGSVQILFSCPVEVVKCTMQSQIPLTMVDATHSGQTTIQPAKFHKGPLHCTKDVIATEGIKGLYKGFFVMFLRDVPSYGLYLLVYESLYISLTRRRLSDEKGALASILAGGIAGCVSWLVVMPFDVIKSRLQVDHGGRFKGFWDCALKSVRRGGYSVLFRGTGLAMLRAFPVNAVTFLVYSQTLQELNIINPPHALSIKDEN